MKKIIAATLIATVTATSALAHGGGLNSNGCHNQHSNGSYHCHNQPQSSGELEGADAVAGIAGLFLLFGLLNEAVNATAHPQVHQPPVSRYAPTTTNRQSYECGTYVVTNRQRMGQVLMQRINTCSGAVMSQWWQKK